MQGPEGAREKKFQLERQEVKVKSLDQIIVPGQRESDSEQPQHTEHFTRSCSCSPWPNSQGMVCPIHTWEPHAQRHESLFRLLTVFSPLDGMVLLFSEFRAAGSRSWNLEGLEHS